MNNMLAALAFMAKYKGWHSFSKERFMTNAIKSLEKRGYLKVDWSARMAQHTGKVFA